MQRASDSIGALAAALAKAQIELVNPEKSRVATIREEGARGREQTFRYAPLSSGLEIVRKFSAGRRSPPSRRPRSIRPPVSLISLLSWRTPQANGSLPTGRYVRLVKPPPRVEWEQH